MGSADDHRLSQLTSREIEFLSLYGEPMLIKEIAFRCGVAEVTVNKALESARKKLNVRSSREAARLVTEWRHYRKAVGQPQSLGATPFSVNLQPSEQDRDWLPPRTGAVLREEQRAYVVSRSFRRRVWQAISASWGTKLELTLRQRAAAIVLLATMIVVAAGTLVTIARGVGHTVAAAVRALS